jgi:hypothetical protein
LYGGVCGDFGDIGVRGRGMGKEERDEFLGSNGSMLYLKYTSTLII